MGLISYALGQTSVVLRVKIIDSSSLTGGKTGLTSASTGLVIGTIVDNAAATVAYTVAGSTIETIATLGTYAAPTATKCRFKEVDATNHKGVYEIQLADARFAVAGAKSLLVSIAGASGACDCDVVIPLTSVNPYIGTNFGLSCLPTAAAGANTGLPVVGTQVPNATAAAAGGLLVVGTGSGAINPSSGAVPVSGDLTSTMKTSVTTAATAATPTASLSGDLTSTMKTSVTTAATAATPTVVLNMAQSVPSSNTAQTLGDALNAARAQGFGKWVLSGTSLTLYAGDGTTVVRTFSLDSATAPTQRT